MVNLLNNNDFLDSRSIKSKELEKEIFKKKEDLQKNNNDNELEKRYFDKSGLSIARMNFGLWFVANRKHFIYMFYILLAVIGVITWYLFFYTYINYIVFGIKEDKKLVYDLLQTNIPSHDFFLARSPLDIEVENIQTFRDINSEYKFLINFNNVNENYYARIDYTLILNGKEVFNDNTFILPEKEKYLLLTNEIFDYQPANVQLRINETKWSRIDKHKYPDWNNFYKEHYKIHFYDIEYIDAKKTALTEKINLNDLKFTVKNNTAYNYTNVELIILLKNSSKRIVETIKYDLSYFMSGETRKIAITLPGNIDDVAKIDILPEIDITKENIYVNFDDSSFDQ